MNDEAVAALGVLLGGDAAVPPDRLSPGLRRLVAEGVEGRGDVVVWAGKGQSGASPPGIFPDLTGWERSVNGFHLEDEVPVEVATTDDDEPLIAERDQVTLLRQGVALAFHRLRSGEQWMADLDRYELEKLVVVEVQPPTPCG